jgi:hypothetical protein
MELEGCVGGREESEGGRCRRNRIEEIWREGGARRGGLRPKPFQADRASTMLDIARGWPVELMVGIRHHIGGNPTYFVVNE